MNRFRKLEGGYIAFRCPGCDEMHVLRVDAQIPKQEPTWSFNGNFERPTLHPSILMRSGHYSQFHKQGDDCWCTYEKRIGEESPFSCKVCHSFVTDGNIQFLNDCTHALVGKTVPLPEVVQ